jgi:signal transduction histidine kinase
MILGVSRCLVPAPTRHDRRCLSAKISVQSTGEIAAGGLQEGTSPEEVGKRLRAVVHELNNPLAVMMGFTQLMMMDGQCEGKLRADLEKVCSELKRLAAVVEKLHAYALSLQHPGQGARPQGGSGPA